MTRLVSLVLALSVLAACDSAGPTETPPTIPPPTAPPGTTPPGPAPSLTFTPPSGESVGEEDGHGLAFALASLFTASGEVGALSYTASPAAGPISARIDGDSLRISLVSAGTAIVSVSATSAAGISARGDIQVRSTGRCPAAVGAGRVALLPDFAEGAEWHFGNEEYESFPTQAAYRIRGTAVLRFGVSTCADGVRTQPVAETLTREVAYQNPHTLEYGPYGPPSVVEKAYEWTTTADQTTTTAPRYPVRNQNVIPPFGLSIPRSVEASAFASGNYINDQDGGSSFGPRVTFRLQTGVIAFAATTNFGTAGNGSVTWTRVLP